VLRRGVGLDADEELLGAHAVRAAATSRKMTGRKNDLAVRFCSPQ
jgi:hypothetical protein